MKYLLDVNALLACEHRGSPHHRQFHDWVRHEGLAQLATCGMIELGFIRVSMQVFGYSLAQAQTAVDTIRPRLGGFLELAPIPHLATWAETPAQTSNAYLVQIAVRHGLQLATFDRKIAGACQIT